MIQLITLGSLDVLGHDGQSVPDALTRPKPFALLLYLVLARPRGFRPQDALLACFWPEADEQRARLSLRQSLHVLRRALGDDVVVRRGRTHVGVDPTRLRCDALTFEAELAAGRPEAALSHYAGPLLPSYAVPDAPDVERWLEDERARLRTLARDATRTLIGAAVARDDVAAAARWALAALVHDPDDERAHGEAMTLLARSGDPSGALRLFDALVAQRLADDDPPPSAALRRTADTIRAELRPARAVVHPPAADPVLPTPVLSVAPPDAPPRAAAVTVAAAPLGARIELPWRRAAAALLLGGVATALWLGRPSPSAATPTGQRASVTASSPLAVLPFVVRGDSAYDYLTDGLAELLTARLDGTVGVGTVDPRLLLSETRGDGRPTVDPVVARRRAARVGAGPFVLGSVLVVDRRFELNATLYDATGGRRASAHASARDEATLVLALDQLARQLLSAEFPRQEEQLGRAAVMTTQSLPALKAFLDGERRFRDGRMDEAAEAFARAVDADSTFALASYRLSTVASYAGNESLVHEAVLRANRHADRLPRRERLLLEARGAVDRGAFDDAERLYRTVVAKYPDDAEAWQQLGESGFHIGPWRGHALSKSADAFTRLLVLQPANVVAHTHLARLAAIAGRRDEADALAARALALPLEREPALEMRALRAALSRDPQAWRRTLETLQAATGELRTFDEDAWLVGWRIATFTDDPSLGAAVASGLADARRVPRVRLLGLTMRAHMEAARGRWREAEHALDAAATLDALLAAEVRANLLLAGPAVEPRTLRAAAAALAHPAAPLQGGARDRVSHDRDVLRDVRLPYLRGALALAAGDTVAAARERATLTRLGVGRPAAAAALARHLAAQLEARARWRRGDAVGALQLVERGWIVGVPGVTLPVFAGASYAPAQERFLRAELLAALGRTAEAREWYDCVTEDLGASLVLSAPTHLRRAQLAERAGDEREAIGEYARAVALWSDADPSVQPQVHAALERLRVLRVLRGRERSIGSRSAP